MCILRVCVCYACVCVCVCVCMLCVHACVCKFCTQRTLHSSYFSPPLGHGEELPFLFHSAPLYGYKFSSEEETLSNQMITYWTNLAKYGDPNGEIGLSWPAYTYQTRSVLRFLTPENKVICNIVC